MPIVNSMLSIYIILIIKIKFHIVDIHQILIMHQSTQIYRIKYQVFILLTILLYLIILPLIVYFKKTTMDESFLLSKKFVRWDRYKCLELNERNFMIIINFIFLVKNWKMENIQQSVQLKSSSTLLIPLLRIYRLHRQQKSEKRCLECLENFIIFKRQNI